MLLLILMILLIIMAACGEAQPEPEEYIAYEEELREEEFHEPEPIIQSSIPIDRAARYFEQANRMFARDGSELWGFDFTTVPIIFVDPATRDAAANMPDLDGVLTKYGDIYVGAFPQYLVVHDIVVNYLDFAGLHWVVVPWPAVEVADVRGMLAHKAFHWAQNELFGGYRRMWDNSHMNEIDVRINIRLEANALIAALNSTGDDRLAAIHDALSIRAERRRVFKRTEDENRFKMAEGTTQYTEISFNVSRANRMNILEGWAQGMLSGDALEPSFGYSVGALYSFVLDEVGADWKNGLRWDSDLGEILKEAVGITGLIPFDRIDLEQYGYAQIAAQERAWATERKRQFEEITELFADNPTLRIYSENLYPAFSAIVSTMPGWGRVFRGSVDLHGGFGHLIVQDGIYISHQDGFGMVVAEGIKIDGNRAFGANWTLELNDGYEILADGDDFKVISQ